jgi:hypothetical protein
MTHQADFKKKKSTLTDNLLEILRGTGSDQNTDQAKQFPEEVSLEEISRRREEQLRQIRRPPQEYVIFTPRQQEEQLQIKTTQEKLQEEVKKSPHPVDKEIEIAIEQKPVDPGVYHLNFFERLQQLIIARKKVDESATWLEVFNTRVKKRGHYWAGVGKAGTKFMLSPDRVVATSVG